MASILPLRLLSHVDGNFSVVDSRLHEVQDFDIISYRWGEKVPPYKCDINGVDWDVTISETKLQDIKRLMIHSGMQYLWVDCVCIKQSDEREKAAEIAQMYQYYMSARKCHILIDMVQVWDPQDIVNDLWFLGHILSHMKGAALASEAKLTENLTNRLKGWEDKEWAFPLSKSIVRSAAVELGVLNCYSTCINCITSLFKNLYFSRVWTFQELLLGKNITMWGMNDKSISCIGALGTWIDLATDSKDKAFQLRDWIKECRVLQTAAVSAVLRIIEEVNLDLSRLQIQVMGISCARADIIYGGPRWWYDNYRGVSNVFSAVSIKPRQCEQRPDIFRGLLGVFSGLFTAEEIEQEMNGDDIEKISFAFFKQLSTKTERAWTRLAISSKERGEWDWIPVIAQSNDRLLTTDCFAGVVNLGRLKPKGLAKATATTGISGSPRQYMKIMLSEGSLDFRFIFKGCNCGKKLKTGAFSSEPIPTYDQPKDVVRDETGRMLVHCATILGSLIDPGYDVVEYRRRLLTKLQPDWNISDPSAKPSNWIDRCVSGSTWEKPDPQLFRVHNRSMDWNMVDITDCGSRLENESTAKISCEVTVNCGCKIIAPFALIFEAITAVENSFLGDASATLDDDNRIVLQDGLGLVQVGDVGRSFNLIAFGGDIQAHKSYASACRSTKENKSVVPKLPWPKGRALVREEFSHDLTNMMRDYGYVKNEGSGNLLICRNNPMEPYKVIGVCIDDEIDNKKGSNTVTIR